MINVIINSLYYLMRIIKKKKSETPAPSDQIDIAPKPTAVVKKKARGPVKKKK